MNSDINNAFLKILDWQQFFVDIAPIYSNASLRKKVTKPLVPQTSEKYVGFNLCWLFLKSLEILNKFFGEESKLYSIVFDIKFPKLNYIK